MDGDVDLAIANSSSDNMTIRLGAGDGTFPTEPPGSPLPAGDGPSSVAVGDFDSDGNDDLAVANLNSDDITVRYGAGDGSFFVESAGSPFPTGDGPTSVAVGHFDSDANEDLVVANVTSDNITVRLGAGDGTFPTEPTGSPFGAGSRPSSVAIGDFNSDGSEDIAVANDFSADVTIRLGAGDGSFATEPLGSPFGAGFQPRSVVIGDFNSDGDEDLAVANFTGDNVTVRLGAGNGTFPTEPAGSPFPAGDSPQSVAIGDFSADGNEDLAVANAFSNGVTIRLGSGPALLFGNRLQNGGIEGSGAARKSDQAPALRDGWQRKSGRFTYARYGIAGGPPRHLPAARWEGGMNAFWGGPTSSDSSAAQTIDVSSLAEEIDSSALEATIEADLGGRGGQNDRMSVWADSLDANGDLLDRDLLGPLDAADRDNRTVLLGRSQTFVVRQSTRSIRIQLNAEWSAGPTNDAYADNVKLTLQTAECTITGTPGKDRLIGTASDDVICGLGGDDVIRGGGGADDLLGGAANDRLIADDLTGGPGEVDTLDGGSGRDRLEPGAPLASDLLIGGPGARDLADYSQKTAPVVLAIDANDGSGESGEGDQIDTDVEALRGGSGDDSLLADPAAALQGPGAFLRGGPGDDVLSGTAGRDILDGGAGADLLGGGDGVDRAEYSTRSDDVWLSIGDGANDGGVGEGDEIDIDVEWLIGGDGDDTLTGTDFANRIDGRGGDDHLSGKSGKDRLFGGPGNDDLDAIDAPAYVDSLSCGTGIDTHTAEPADLVGADCE